MSLTMKLTAARLEYFLKPELRLLKAPLQDFVKTAEPKCGMTSGFARVAGLKPNKRHNHLRRPNNRLCYAKNADLRFGLKKSFVRTAERLNKRNINQEYFRHIPFYIRKTTKGWHIMTNTNKQFCEKCGDELADGAKFCEGCGSQVEQPSQSSQPQYRPPVQPNPAVASKDYSKLGGWLLAWVIASILSVLVYTVRAFGEIIGSMDVRHLIDTDIFYLIISGQIVALAAVVFFIMSIVQIFKRKPLFLRFEQIGLILIAVSVVLDTFIPAGMIGLDWYDTEVLTNSISIFIGCAVGFFLYTLYFCRSVRVRTYMGADEYAKKALFAYKQQPLK
jgi:hypothetical protein